LKNDKNFNQLQSLSETFVLVFNAQYLRFWEQWLKEVLWCHRGGSVKIDILFYGHHWGEPCLTQI